MAKTNGKQPTVTHRGYLHLPDALVLDPDYIEMSRPAKCLLIDIGIQYKGHNNGDLCASITVMRKQGWNSSSLLHRARTELVERFWLIQTKQGGMGIGPNLYAITWQPIHYCGGKLDVEPTTTPPRKLNERKAK